jgi:hypothetical protein
MSSKNIRTTITLPSHLHQELREKAFRYHKSFNEVILDQLREKPEQEYHSKSIDVQVEEDLSFFQQVGKMGKQIDLMKAIREERDR